ncbi:hypothetical protein ACI792_11920, partial [Blastococcus sp. SYSU DS0669]
MKGADVRGPMPLGWLLDAAHQELGEAARAAHERDTLALCGEPARLLHGQPRLARAGSPTDLHPVVRGEQVEHLGLVLGEQVAGGPPFGQFGEQVLLRDRRPGEAVDQLIDVLGGRRVRLVTDPLQGRPDACGGVRDVGLVERHPAGQAGCHEVAGQRGRGHRHEVGGARSSAGPAGVLGQVLAEQVLAGDRLVHGVDDAVDSVLPLPPP